MYMYIHNQLNLIYVCKGSMVIHPVMAIAHGFAKTGCLVGSYFGKWLHLLPEWYRPIAMIKQL